MHGFFIILGEIPEVIIDHIPRTGLGSVLSGFQSTTARGGGTGMAISSIAKASRVERAVERLEAAVNRLDEALVSAPVGTDAMAGSGDMQSLRDENVELRNLNRDAAERLGGAILKIQGLLENRADS